MADNRRSNDINQEVGSFKQTYGSNSVDLLTFEQARAKYREEASRKLSEIENKKLKEQAALESALRAKGLTEADKQWKKLLSEQAREEGKWKQLQLKANKVQELKDLEEVYAYESDLNKELAANRKKLNEAILKSHFSSFSDKLKAFGSLMGDNLKTALGNAAGHAINKLTSGLDGIMSTYANYQAKINARMQGTGYTYKRLEDNLSSAVGITPYIKTQTMVENLANLVDSGIAYNVELRAFIASVKDNIASTFDAANGTLLRLVRIQQADSTASRLGLEANLTRYFNAMYQNTEYLTSEFDVVSEALLEASSTMTSSQAVEFEYQVQKWLGSLYGVGTSSSTIQGLAQAIGMLGSGNISGLSGSQYQSLLAMAAQRAGLSYGELISGGLTSETTNSLLEAMVDYLKEIAESSDSKVVQSEWGRAFGVSMSDLMSALNLNTEIMNSVSNQNITYNSTLGELMYQLKQLPERMSIATMMDNIWSNLEWSLGTSVASNPAMYGIWKVTSLIQDYTGGINIPSIFAMGSGANLNTSVENLIKLGIVGISSLGMIGDLISGMSNTKDPSGMLTKLLKISNVTTTGGGLTASMSGMTTSSTTVVGQSSGEDIYSSTLSGAQGSANEAVADAGKSNEAAQMTEEIRDNVANILVVIQSIADKFDSVIGVGFGGPAIKTTSDIH